MRRVRVVMFAGLVPFGIGAGVLFATSAGTINPGPPQLPAVQLIAENACTGGVVPGLTVSFLPASGEGNPGPIQNVGITHSFPDADFVAGTYYVVLSAPGFAGIGSAASGTSPITVTKNPGPNGFVVDSGLSETQVVSVALMPDTFPPNPCLDLSAQTVPALTAVLQDGLTHQLLQQTEQAGISYFFQHAAGGNQLVPSPNPGGSWTISSASMPAGTYDVNLGAQGYYPLGTAPDGSLTPLEVTVNPGPINLPTGDSYDQGVSAAFALAPDQPVPTITEASPKSGPRSGATTVHIVGTGFGGTYSVSFGPNPAASFTVNKAGTSISAVSPSSTTTGPVQITVTTLGGTATTTFGYS